MQISDESNEEENQNWVGDYKNLIKNGVISDKHGLALLHAFRQDTVKNRYQDWNELIDYCMYSAAPVGRAVLEINREWQADIKASDALCAALQIINHIQDVKGDYLNLNRIYIPGIWLKNEDDLKDNKMSDNFKMAINNMLNEVDRLLEISDALPQSILSTRLRAEISAISKIAYKLAKKLRENDILANNIKLTKYEYVGCMIFGIVSGIFQKSNSDKKLRNRAITFASSSSFMGGMMHLEKQRRLAIFSLYAFCRVADDIVDESIRTQNIEAEIFALQDDVAILYENNPISYPKHAVTRSLAPLIRAYNLERKYLDDFLDGMMMDAKNQIIKPTMAEFEDYCYRVAGCVGLLAINIFGCKNEQSKQVARSMGLGLQIVNILRDIAEDADRGRIYMPIELLEKYGIADVSFEQLQNPDDAVQIALDKIYIEMIDRAEAAFDDVKHNITSEDEEALKPAILMQKSYLKKIEKLKKKVGIS